jgi:hypothetical protein
MLDLNRNKYINGLCAIVFLLATSMFVVGSVNQSGKDILLGLGLMCITYPSVVSLLKKLKKTDQDSFNNDDAQSYDRLSLLGLILTIIALVFL